MREEQKLTAKIQAQIKRMKKADRERPTLLAQTVYLSTVSLVLVLPIVTGVYLGRWLDSLMPGYSIHWTLGLLLAGVAIGIFNLYFLVKE